MKPWGRTGIVKGVLVASVCLGLAGCLSLGTKPPPVLLSLTPAEIAPVGATANGQLDDAIVVIDPETDRSLDVLRVPVQVDASRIAYLKDAVWVEKPARQFRALLAETIRARGGKLVVEGGDFEVVGKTRIGGRLLQMGYDARKQAVIVRMDAMLSGRDSNAGIASKRFEAVVNDVAPKAGAVGPALNQAANDVARQIADWVKDN